MYSMDDDEEEDWDGEEGRNGGRRSSIYLLRHTYNSSNGPRPTGKETAFIPMIQTQNPDDR